MKNGKHLAAVPSNKIPAKCPKNSFTVLRIKRLEHSPTKLPSRVLLRIM